MWFTLADRRSTVARNDDSDGRTPVNWKLPALAALGALTLVAGPASAAHDELKIGVAQFPPNMHPAIEPTVVESYVRNIRVKLYEKAKAVYQEAR